MHRKSFLGLGVLAAISPAATWQRVVLGSSATALAANFPSQEMEAVQEIVTVSHSNLDRVRAMITARPALARASFDWGYGDWESAIDAASHVGRADIATLLMEYGARPTHFTAAMLGQLDVLRGMIEATPGLQKRPGPHGITLLAHARAGGVKADPVRVYLEQLGDADLRPVALSTTDAQRAVFVGRYRFGTGADELLEVTDVRGTLNVTRPGKPARGLRRAADTTFNPVGAETVRLTFVVRDDRAVELAVYDPGLLVTARRE